MAKFLLGVLLTIGMYVGAYACRFTVREIGFSTLARDTYALVVVSKETKASDQLFQDVRKRLDDANISLEVVDPVRNGDHPFVIEVIQRKSSLPAYALMAPDGRILELAASGLVDLVDKVLDSPVRSKLRDGFTEVFAVVLWIEGKDQAGNLDSEKIIEEDCGRIKSIIPYMPKSVRHGPISIRLSPKDFQTEKILLWSLGIEQQSDEAVACVLYGRGRMMGDVLNATAIAENRLFTYMSMIGADCECGLDRKWMLGRQIPLLWPADNRQHLAEQLGFDVDNPMILVEMSQILAKETDLDVSGEVGFGPEVIDLNTAFGRVPESDDKEVVAEKKPASILIIISAFFALIVTVGLFIYYRNTNR